MTTTQVTTSLPLWLAGCTYDIAGGNDLRNSGVTAFFYDPGIVSGGTIGVLGGIIGGAGLKVGAGTGMTVTVQPGSYVVPASAAPTAGGYVSTLSSTATLNVQTADPASPRVDLVVAYVSDTGTSASFGAVEIITGVAGTSPSAPAAPANSVSLATIAVAAGTSGVTSGMISDLRTYTTATGGVLVAPKGTVPGYTGQVAYDKTSNTFYHNDNTFGGTQMHVLPWQPNVQKRTTPDTLPGDGGEYLILTAGIVTDGYTDIEVFFKCPGISSSSSSSAVIRPEFRMYLDNTMIDSLYGAEVAADTLWQSGVAWSYYTSPATADTPSAGPHTIKVTVQNTHSSVAYSVQASASSNVLLRVEPVGM